MESQQGNIAEDHTLKCGRCPSKLLDVASLDAHERSHVELKPYLCMVCSGVRHCFSSLNSCEQHFRDQHGITKLFGCGLCTDSQQTYAEAEPLLVHLHSCHTRGEKALSCHLCREVYHDLELYHKHMEDSHSIKARHIVYWCVICELKFPTFATFTQHRMMKHGECDRLPPFKCRFCDEAFWDGPSRESHEVKHTVEPLYTCKLCSMVFKDQRGLWDHLKADSELPCKMLGPPVPQLVTPVADMGLVDVNRLAVQRQTNVSPGVMSTTVTNVRVCGLSLPHKPNDGFFCCDLCSNTFSKEAFEKHSHMFKVPSPIQGTSVVLTAQDLKQMVVSDRAISNSPLNQLAEIALKSKQMPPQPRAIRPNTGIIADIVQSNIRKQSQTSSAAARPYNICSADEQRQIMTLQAKGDGMMDDDCQPPPYTILKMLEVYPVSHFTPHLKTKLVMLLSKFSIDQVFKVVSVCSSCFSVFDNTKEYKKHALKHKNGATDLRVPPENLSTGIFKENAEDTQHACGVICLHCLQPFAHFFEFYQHVKSVGMQWKCGCIHGLQTYPEDACLEVLKGVRLSLASSKPDQERGKQGDNFSTIRHNLQRIQTHLTKIKVTTPVHSPSASPGKVAPTIETVLTDQLVTSAMSRVKMNGVPPAPLSNQTSEITMNGNEATFTNSQVATIPSNELHVKSTITANEKSLTGTDMVLKGMLNGSSTRGVEMDASHSSIDGSGAHVNKIQITDIGSHSEQSLSPTASGVSNDASVHGAPEHVHRTGSLGESVAQALNLTSVVKEKTSTPNSPVRDSQAYFTNSEETIASQEEAFLPIEGDEDNSSTTKQGTADEEISQPLDSKEIVTGESVLPSKRSRKRPRRFLEGHVERKISNKKQAQQKNLIAKEDTLSSSSQEKMESEKPPKQPVTKRKARKGVPHKVSQVTNDNVENESTEDEGREKMSGNESLDAIQLPAIMLMKVERDEDMLDMNDDIATQQQGGHSDQKSMSSSEEGIPPNPTKDDIEDMDAYEQVESNDEIWEKALQFVKIPVVKLHRVSSGSNMESMDVNEDSGQETNTESTHEEKVEENVIQDACSVEPMEMKSDEVKSQDDIQVSSTNEKDSNAGTISSSLDGINNPKDNQSVVNTGLDCSNGNQGECLDVADKTVGNVISEMVGQPCQTPTNISENKPTKRDEMDISGAEAESQGATLCKDEMKAGGDKVKCHIKSQKHEADDVELRFYKARNQVLEEEVAKLQSEMKEEQQRMRSAAIQSVDLTKTDKELNYILGEDLSRKCKRLEEERMHLLTRHAEQYRKMEEDKCHLLQRLEGAEMALKQYQSQHNRSDKALKKENDKLILENAQIKTGVNEFKKYHEKVCDSHEVKMKDLTAKRAHAEEINKKNTSQITELEKVLKSTQDLHNANANVFRSRIMEKDRNIASLRTRLTTLQENFNKCMTSTSSVNMEKEMWKQKCSNLEISLNEAVQAQIQSSNANEFNENRNRELSDKITLLRKDILQLIQMLDGDLVKDIDKNLESVDAKLKVVIQHLTD